MNSTCTQIDTPQDEDLVVTLLLNAVAEYLQKTKTDVKYLNEIKLQKIIYKTSDDLDIPLTRSWYKRGCYVHNPNIRVESVKNILRSDIDVDEVAQFKRECKGEYESILSTITRNIKRFQYITTERLLDKLYQNNAPERYRELYRANNTILVTNKQIKDSLCDWSNLLYNQKSINKYYYYRLLTDSISRVHIELARNEEFNRIVNQYINFTDFLESIYIKVDNILTPGRTVPIEVSNLFKSIDSKYYEYVWGCPALIISKETVKGSMADLYIENAEAQILRGFDDLDGVLNELESQSESIGLSPTIDELEDLDKTLNILSESKADSALVEFWNIYNTV